MTLKKKDISCYIAHEEFSENWRIWIQKDDIFRRGVMLPLPFFYLEGTMGDIFLILLIMLMVAYAFWDELFTE